MSGSWKAITSPEEKDQKRIEFWLRELRTPSLLKEVAHHNFQLAPKIALTRPALKALLENRPAEAASLLDQEKAKEIAADNRYWDPLRNELEAMRHNIARVAKEKKRRDPPPFP